MGHTTRTTAELTPNGIWIEGDEGPDFITKPELSEELQDRLPGR